MASKSQTMFNGIQRGRVGSIVGFKRDDPEAPQGIRPYVKPSNPRTYAQALQRCHFAAASKWMGMLSQISDHNVEGVTVGRKCRAEFVRRCMCYELFTAKGYNVVSANPNRNYAFSLPVSFGSLEIDWEPNDNPPISIDEDFISDSGLMVGDVLTFIKIGYTSFKLDKYDITSLTGPVKILQQKIEVGSRGFISGQDGAIFCSILDLQEVPGYYALILERTDGGEHLISTSYVYDLDILAYDVERKLFVESYMNRKPKGADKYLYGSTL